MTKDTDDGCSLTYKLFKEITAKLVAGRLFLFVMDISDVI